MAKTDPLEQRLAALRRLRQDPHGPEAKRLLSEALSRRSNQLVAEAARIAGEYEVPELEADLAAAFDSFMIRPQRSDPGCTAKSAIAEALVRLDSGAFDLFLQGIHHTQPEPVYGGTADTAAPLRATCALGLVRAGYPEALAELADLLADPEADARIGAARALAYTGQAAAVPLLRFKALTGDLHAQVIYECFSALLLLDGRRSPAFVARFLNIEDEAVSEAAFLALGESRLEAAFQHLKAGWEALENPRLARIALTALAIMRRQPAVTYLLDLLARAEPETASMVLAALEVYREDSRVWPRVSDAAEQRDDLEVKGGARRP